MIEGPVRDHDVGFHLCKPGGDLLQGGFIGDQFLMGIREDLRFRSKNFAGGGCLRTANLGFWPPEETTVASE